MLDGRDVGDVVAVPAVAVPEDGGGAEAVDEDDQRAVVDDSDPASLEVLADRGEHVVVDRLTGEVVVGEQDAEPLVRRVEPGGRDLDEAVPHRERGLVAGLQGDDLGPGPVGERLVGGQVGVRAQVQLLELGEVQPGQVEVLLDHLLDEHAELAAPVADVVLGDDGVARRGEHPVEAVADDRGAQVPDVHELGDVGGAVVDDDPLRLGGHLDAGVRVLEHLGRDLREHVRPDADVDEAGAGDLHRLAQVVEVEACHQVGRDLAGRTTLLLREAEGDVALEVPELRLRRRSELGVYSRHGLEAFSEGLDQRQHRHIVPQAR